VPFAPSLYLSLINLAIVTPSLFSGHCDMSIQNRRGSGTRESSFRRLKSLRFSACRKPTYSIFLQRSGR
jgi:hypothetical protein